MSKSPSVQNSTFGSISSTAEQHYIFIPEHGVALTFSCFAFIRAFTPLSAFIDLLKLSRGVFPLSVCDLYPLARDQNKNKNQGCLYAGHIHLMPTVCGCCVFLCLCVTWGGLIVGSAYTSSPAD